MWAMKYNAIIEFKQTIIYMNVQAQSDGTVNTLPQTKLNIITKLYLMCRLLFQFTQEYLGKEVIPF